MVLGRKGQFDGAYTPNVDLAQGRFAVVQSDKALTLVRWQAGFGGAPWAGAVSEPLWADYELTAFKWARVWAIRIANPFALTTPRAELHIHR